MTCLHCLIRMSPQSRFSSPSVFSCTASSVHCHALLFSPSQSAKHDQAWIQINLLPIVYNLRMLASPVSPSISLGSRTHTSPSGSSSASLHHHNSSSVSSPNGTYASPRHPAYLPSSSNDNNNNNNATSPSSQRSITSSSPGGDANSTSNYSKYTTISQIERVNDVLVDKVLHAPIPLSHDHQYQQQRYGRNEEQGSALRRLIAFLDGEDHEIGNAVSNAPTAGPSHSHTAAMHVSWLRETVKSTIKL